MRQLSRSSFGALLAALVLVAVGVTTWQLLALERQPPQQPAPREGTVSIALAANNLVELALDPTIHEVVLRIHNTTAQPVRVIGFQGGCFGTCCCRAKPAMNLPFVIPPGSEADFSAELRVYAPGPFEAPMVVFVDQGSLRELSITVTGTGAKETAPSGSTPSP